MGDFASKTLLWDFATKKVPLEFAQPVGSLSGSGRLWICRAGLMHLSGRQTMTMDSANLWFRPPTSYSVASEDAGAFGTVCKPIGVDIKI